jgi:hypothetical protein
MDDLSLNHWLKGSEDRNELFSKFNTRTPVVRYNSLREYNAAGISSLSSSTSWSKFETDCLFDLCE